MSIRRALPGLVAMAFFATGCGIPVTNQASSVPPHAVPFHLLSPTVPTSTTTTVPAAAFVAERIYLVGPTEAILPVGRDVGIPAPLTAVLEALLAGPSRSEAAIGITSAIPGDVRVVSATVEGTTAFLNLNAAFGQISPQEETRAVAQLVLTTTSQQGISSVGFEIAGHPIAVPTANGASTKGPVSAASYSSLRRAG